MLLALLLSTAALLAQDALPTGTRAEEADAIIRAPEVLELVEAPYPRDADAVGLETTVRLAVQLDATGTVQGVEVIEAVGHGFDEAAVAAVTRSRFSPAETTDGPVPVVIEFDYRFELHPAEAPSGQEPEAPVNLTGRLLEKGTRTPLVGATVYVVGAGRINVAGITPANIAPFADAVATVIGRG